MEAPRLFVVKKDGRREQYSRDKILSGLRRACEKRPVSDAQMEDIVSGLERSNFAARRERSAIGARRREADGSAQSRRSGGLHSFASVYRSFRDVESFQAELAELLSK